jgi:membrane associated rhomboid family serine protease
VTSRGSGWDSGSDRVVDGTARFGTDAFYIAIGRAFVTMCAVVPFLALIELADQAVNHELDRLGGIRPRQLSGLDGIIFAPLLHVNFEHLIGNSVALIILGTFALATGARRFAIATAIITVVSGMGVWLLTPTNYLVLGASGVIFGYVGYLLLRGILQHSVWNIAAALLVALLFGSSVLGGVMPGDSSVSWQGHLFGFVGGLIAAVFVRQRRVRTARMPKTQVPDYLPDDLTETRPDLDPIRDPDKETDRGHEPDKP